MAWHYEFSGLFHSALLFEGGTQEKLNLPDYGPVTLTFKSEHDGSAQVATTMQVKLETSAEFPDSVAVGNLLLVNVAEQLAYTFDTPVIPKLPVSVKALQISKEGNVQSQLATVTLRVSTTGFITQTVRTGHKKLGLALQQVEDPSRSDLRAQYTFALSQSPVSQFLLLYKLMQQIHGDSQAKIDNWIWKTVPGEPRLSRIRTAGKPGLVNETVYTLLRNKLSHTISTTSNAELAREVAQHLMAFRMVVRTAIAEQEK